MSGVVNAVLKTGVKIMNGQEKFYGELISLLMIQDFHIIINLIPPEFRIIN